MPSSKVGQIALIMGSIVTDTEMCYGTLPQKNKEIWLKQLNEYSKQLDAIVDEAEKGAYKVGFDTAKGIPFEGYEAKYKVLPQDVKPKSQRLVPDIPEKKIDDLEK